MHCAATAVIAELLELYVRKLWISPDDKWLRTWLACIVARTSVALYLNVKQICDNCDYRYHTNLQQVGKTEPKVHTKYIKLYISVDSAILDCCSKLTAKWFVQFQSRWSQIWQIDYSKPENLKTGLGLVWHIDYAISKKASKICC